MVLKQGVISEKKVKSWNWVCHNYTETSKEKISEEKGLKKMDGIPWGFFGVFFFLGGLTAAVMDSQVPTVMNSQVLIAWLNHENWLHVGFTSTDCMTESWKSTACWIHSTACFWHWLRDCMTDSQKSTAYSIHKHWLHDCFTKINCILDS